MTVAIGPFALEKIRFPHSWTSSDGRIVFIKEGAAGWTCYANDADEQLLQASGFPVWRDDFYPRPHLALKAMSAAIGCADVLVMQPRPSTYAISHITPDTGFTIRRSEHTRLWKTDASTQLYPTRYEALAAMLQYLIRAEEVFAQESPYISCYPHAHSVVTAVKQLDQSLLERYKIIDVHPQPA